MTAKEQKCLQEVVVLTMSRLSNHPSQERLPFIWRTKLMLHEVFVCIPLRNAEDGLEYKAVKGTDAPRSEFNPSMACRLLSISVSLLRKTAFVAISEAGEFERTFEFRVLGHADLAIHIAWMVFF